MIGLWPVQASGHCQCAHDARSPRVAAARAASWRARRRLNDSGDPKLIEGPGDGLLVATGETKSGGQEGCAHQGGRDFVAACVPMVRG
jgi:hypothetical protein